MILVINLIGLTVLNILLRSMGLGFFEMLMIDILALVVVNSLAHEPPTNEDKNDNDT